MRSQHEIVYRHPGSLKPYEQNTKLHPPEQVAAIAEIIRETGFNNPILIDEDGEIIAGHGRQLAAAHLELDSVPTITLRGLSEAQKRALRIADNKLAERASWDNDMLRLELGDLSSMAFDLKLTGFTLGELDKIMATPRAGRGDPDDMPTDVPAEPVSTPGTVWLLGSHRLCCGDAGNQDHVDALMLGMEADLCLTSPPYSGQRRYGGTEIDDWDALMQRVFSLLPMADTGNVMVNLGLIHREHEWQPYWDGWIEFMRLAGWRRFGLYVWDQGAALSGDFRGRLPPSFEFVFHFNRVSPRVRKTVTSKHVGKMSKGMLRSGENTFTGLRAKGATEIQPTRKMDSVIRVTRHKGALGKGIDHPAVYPVGFCTEIIGAYTDVGFGVYDPFCGAGTTLLACEQLQRVGYGMELQPRYTDIGVIRWQRFTGRQAVRERDGVAFDTLAARVAA